MTIRANSWESLLLDRGRAELDALEHRGVQDIDTGIDTVSHEFDRLLDKAVDARRVVGLVDYDTIFRRFFDFGDDDRSLLTVCLVKCGEIRKGVFADNIGVQDEEGAVVFSEDFFGELERACSAKGFGFD